MTKTLFVGNLPYTLTEQEFVGHFSKFGGTNARIIDQRGFGFIDVEADQMADAIEATNMKDLAGRTIAVNEAQPKASGPRPQGNRPGGGSYSGGYSGGGYGGRSTGSTGSRSNSGGFRRSRW